MARNSLTAKGKQSSHPAMSVQSTVEREIKLSVDDGFKMPPLHGMPLSRRFLTSIYYDTPQYDLTHGGITLRRRLQQGRHTWQLKLPLKHDRQEVAIDDRKSTPPAALRDLLVLHIDQRTLEPIATLKTRRTGVRVKRGNMAVADVTLDDVAVVKERGVIQRFRELEIERRDGDDEALNDIEQQLRQAGAEEHDGRPKLFRALSLPPPGDDAPAPDAPVVEYVKGALGRHVRWLLAHEPGTRLGVEPESVHQMRVATRQLRAVFHAAKPLLVPEWADSWREELKWLTELLGPARDLDVQLVYFRGEAIHMAARDRKPLTRFIEQLSAERTQVQEKLLSEMNSARYLDLMRRLQQATNDPAFVASSVTLRDLAAREFKQLRKEIRRLGDSPSSARVHKVRIKTKRARYIAELVEPAVGKPASRFIKRARAVQEVIGRHQDAIQAESHVQSFLKQSTGVRAGFVAGRMVERQRERRESARKKMRKLWKGLLKRGKRAWK